MPIPKERPVIGKDLDDIRERLDLSTADACWAFGLSMNAWTDVAKSGADQVIENPTLALLARFLDEHPEVVVIPKMPSAQEVFDLVNGVMETPQRSMSVMLGNEETAAYRWLKVGTRQPPTVQRLLFGIKQALLRRPEVNAKLELLNAWRKTVDQEAKARGVDDVFATGQWPPKLSREEREERRLLMKAAKLAKKGAEK